MFTRIYYDSYKNRLYCNEYENGKRKKHDFHPMFEYYVPYNDTSGESNQQEEFRDIYGNRVMPQSSDSRQSMKQVASCTKTCETDIPEDVKFLQKRYKGRTLKVNIGNFQIATIDIEVESEKEFPKPEEAKFPINLISIHYSKEDEVYTFGTRPYTGDSPLVKNYHYCPDEKTMLERFIKHFRKKSVDILTGWNVMGFDVPYIVNRCRNLKIETLLSPINLDYVQRKTGGYHIEGGGFTIPGISILDGLELYKNFVYTKRERYSLQFIGKLEVDEGKKDLEGTVNTAWKQWNEFVEYNIQDVLLCKKIEDKKKHIKLTIQFCYQALIPFERIFSSITLVTGYMLRYLHERNIVFPDRINTEKNKKFPGAYVMAKPGFYEYVVSFDVASMYPHMLMMYNISPETIVMNPEDTDDYYKCPLSKWRTWETVNGDFECGGIYYRKDKRGVMAEIVSDIYNERKTLKKKGFIADAIAKGRSLEGYPQELIDAVKSEGETSEYYDSQQLIRKILINSVYGVLGNPFFNFFNVNNAIAVTLSGQDLIRYLSNTLNNYMKQKWHEIGPKLYPYAKCDWKPLEKDVVILIDTDSNYVCLQEIVRNMGLEFKNNQEFYDWVDDLDERFFKPFFDKILKIYANNYGVPQLIDFKREKIITQKFILAKKKYADEVIANEDKLYIDEPKISITGIEVVRTDTPQFSRERIMGVIRKIFNVRGKDKEAVLTKLRKIHNEFLEAGPSDIANPTGIKDYTKYAEPVEKYIENNEISYPKHLPIHVRAAMNYNFVVAKNDLPLMPVNNGTKMKYIYVAPHKNEIHQNIIGFVNEWPKEFDDLFYIDTEEQWKKVFQNAIQRFFNVLGWGEIEIEENSLSDFIEF